MNPNSPADRPGARRNAAVVAIGKSKIFHRVRDPVLIADVTNWVGMHRNHMITYAGAAPPALRGPLVTMTNPLLATNTAQAFDIHSETFYELRYPTRGTRIIQPYLEYVCHYANRWHSSLTGVDRHSFATVPMFYAWGVDFIDDLRTRGVAPLSDLLGLQMSAAQFLTMRYFFLPISFGPTPTQTHAALIVISPEARTFDYLCSEGDDGQRRLLANGGAGSYCIELVFQFLADFLGPLFNRDEWRMRQNESALQPVGPPRTNCGVIAVTYAQCLAYGYPIRDLRTRVWNFHERRMRIAQDLIHRDFDLWTPAAGTSEFYFPLLDTPPTNDALDGWRPLNARVKEALLYSTCPGINRMTQHCARNAQWYPNYLNGAVSGINGTLRDFRSWVQRQDDYRRRRVAPFNNPAGFPAWRSPTANPPLWNS